MTARSVGIALLVLATLPSACESSTSRTDPEPVPVTTGQVRPTTLPPHLGVTRPYVAPEPVRDDPLAGFEPVFAQHVARHGARTLTGGDDVRTLLELWDEAAAEDALTEVGIRFGRAARTLTDAMEEIGYGELSTLGRREHTGLGTREGRRLAVLFRDAERAGARVDLVDSGRSRTVESAERFAAGLTSVHPDLVVAPSRSDPRLLHFDTEDPDYAAFLDGDDWRPPWRASPAFAEREAAARDVLDRLLEPTFVERLEDPVEVAVAVHDLYRAAPSMVHDRRVDMTPFMAPSDAEAFAATTDARYFFARGPGVRGDGRPHEPARVLLDDFFAAVDEALDPGAPRRLAATYRFAHAEEIVPLAALLRLPHVDEPLPVGAAFSYAASTFRVDRVAPLAGSIGWTVWRDPDGTTLVSMRVHERPTPFHDQCRPFAGSTLFVELTELRLCLRR